MPPKRSQLASKKEESTVSKREKRPLQQSILDVLPNSIDKGSKKVFKDTTHGCRDPIIPISGWDLFWYFYEKRVEKIPVLNPWTLDLAKLIVPNVFIDVEFIKVLAQYYHLATRTI